MSSAAHRLLRRTRWPGRWFPLVLVGFVLVVACIGVGIDRVFPSGETQYGWPPEPCVVQGVSARCGTFRSPGEPRRTGRTHDRASRGRPSCAVRGDHRVRLCISRGWAGRRRQPGGARRGVAVEPAAHVSRLPARRPARNRGIEAARRRRDPVRDADGDGRPGRGAGGARLPATRRLRRLLRRNRGAGLPQAPSLAGPRAHPLRCPPRSTSLSSAATPSTPSAPSTSSRSSVTREPVCRKAFPGWERQFGEIVRAWNAHPVHGLTGDQFASVVHKDVAQREHSRSRSRSSSAAPRRAITDLWARGLGGTRLRRPEPHGRVDLVQRTLGRARREGAVGHGLRQLYDGIHCGVPAEGMQLRHETRRAALALEVGYV